MITAYFILTILIVISLLVIFSSATKPKETKEYPVATKQDVRAEKEKPTYKRKFKYKKYVRGNFFGLMNLPPWVYGAKLCNRRGYSHKKTNKDDSKGI